MKICINPDCDAGKDRIEWEDNISACPLCGGKNFEYPNKPEEVKEEEIVLKIEEYKELDVIDIHRIVTKGLLTCEDTIPIPKKLENCVETKIPKRIIIVAPEETEHPKKVTVAPIEQQKVEIPKPVAESSPVSVSVPTTAHPVSPEPETKVETIEIEEESSAIASMKEFVSKGIEQIKKKENSKKIAKTEKKEAEVKKEDKIYRRVEILLYVLIFILFIMLLVFLFKIDVTGISAPDFFNTSLNNSVNAT